MVSLIKATNNKKFPASIVVVITDNELAPGIKIAKNYNIPTKIFDKKKFSIKKFENESQKILLSYKIEIFCLAGFMKILSNNFINLWKY